MFTFNVVKRTLYALLLALCFASTHAQETYFGGGAAFITSSAYGPAPLLSAQIGRLTAPEFGSLELRATFDTLLLFSNVGFDAFTSVRFPSASSRVYLGGGPDVLIVTAVDTLPLGEGPQVFFGAHGTVGLEPLSGSVRPFAELQPAAALIYGEPVFGLRLRAGVNVYPCLPLKCLPLESGGQR